MTLEALQAGDEDMEIEELEQEEKPSWSSWRSSVAAHKREASKPD